MSWLLKIDRIASGVIYHLVGAVLYLATLASFVLLGLLVVGVLG